MSTRTPRADPLTFLTDELNSLKAQGLHRSLRVLEVGRDEPVYL